VAIPPEDIDSQERVECGRERTKVWVMVSLGRFASSPRRGEQCGGLARGHGVLYRRHGLTHASVTCPDPSRPSRDSPAAPAGTSSAAPAHQLGSFLCGQFGRLARRRLGRPRHGRIRRIDRPSHQLGRPLGVGSGRPLMAQPAAATGPAPAPLHSGGTISRRRPTS
jgi:hypothetical protein